MILSTQYSVPRSTLWQQTPSKGGKDGRPSLAHPSRFYTVNQRPDECQYVDLSAVDESPTYINVEIHGLIF